MSQKGEVGGGECVVTKPSSLRYCIAAVDAWLWEVGSQALRSEKRRHCFEALNTLRCLEYGTLQRGITILRYLLQNRLSKSASKHRSRAAATHDPHSHATFYHQCTTLPGT